VSEECGSKTCAAFFENEMLLAVTFFLPSRHSRPGLLIKRIAVRWKKRKNTKNAPAVTLVDVTCMMRTL
jgi:hypothetical protein